MEEKRATKLGQFKELVKGYITTIFALVYIFNGIATFVALNGWLDTSDLFNTVVAYIALSFSLIALVTYVNTASQEKLSSKKKGKR